MLVCSITKGITSILDATIAIPKILLVNYLSSPDLEELFSICKK